MKSPIQFDRLPLPDYILIVEEDRALADLMKLALRQQGFIVEITYRADEVEKCIQNYNPLVILLDMFLTGTDGLALLERLKKAGKINNRRVILLSSFSFKEIVEQARTSGAADFMVKPINTDLLVTKVLSWVEKE